MAETDSDADSESEQISIARYTCYQTAETIQLDGRLIEPVWSVVPWSPSFVALIDGSPSPPEFATRAALVWDAEFLYFAFQIPETNLQAALTERDDRIYRENDVEFFIAGTDAYYEFEINARGTVYDVLWIWRDRFEVDPVFRAEQWKVAGPDIFDDGPKPYETPDRGGRLGFIPWNLQGLLTAVHLSGTLNDSTDTDTGWTVEVALPWAGLGIVGEGRSLPPADGDTWRIVASRFEKVSPDRAHRSNVAGWAWNRHGQWDSHMPHLFPHVDFSERILPAR